MKKELSVLIVVALVSVTALLYLAKAAGSTGAAVNPIAQIQVDRAEQARIGFLAGRLPGPCRDETKSIMDLIRLNGDPQFYGRSGLTQGALYFTNEKELFAHLVAVANAGVMGVQGPAAQFSANANACPTNIAGQAKEKLSGIALIDMQFIRKTIDNSGCEDTGAAENLYSQARQQYRANSFTAMLQSLEAANGALCH